MNRAHLVRLDRLDPGTRFRFYSGKVGSFTGRVEEQRTDAVIVHLETGRIGRTDTWSPAMRVERLP